jgi:hypothetical protein
VGGWGEVSKGGKKKTRWAQGEKSLKIKIEIKVNKREKIKVNLPTTLVNTGREKKIPISAPSI